MEKLNEDESLQEEVASIHEISVKYKLHVLYYEFIIRLKIVCVYVIMASIVISKSSEYVKQYNKVYYMMNKSRLLAYGKALL